MLGFVRATELLVIAASVGVVVAGMAGSGCNTPSSTIDGGDLLGVFERDAAVDAAVDGGLRDAGRKDGGIARAAVSSPPRPPVSVRPPSEGSCVNEEGLPNREIRRTLGRPPCRNAQVLEWKDPDGAPRYACVFAPGGVETRAPLPLVIYIHGPDGSPTNFDKKTGLRKLAARFDLTGDPAHNGFVVLAPQGRNIKWGKSGVLFDTEHIGTDNVDVMAIDHFMHVLLDRKIIDRRRIYVLGDSLGGHMAATYAMLRADRIAAFAVYGSDAPRATWSCPGPPPPGMVVYRACDDLVPCESVERWLRSRDALSAETTSLRLGEAGSEELHCAVSNKCTSKKGTINHRRWPKTREGDILQFFSRHTLSVPP